MLSSSQLVTTNKHPTFCEKLDALPVKVKLKVYTLDTAPLRSESPPQKRSGMARVLKGFQFYLHTHTFIRNRNEPYLPLSSQL